MSNQSGDDGRWRRTGAAAWGDGQQQGWPQAQTPMQGYPQQGYPAQPYAQQPYYPPQPQGYWPAPQAIQQVVVVQQNNARAVYMKPPFQHGMHFILDIVTCGVWLPFHIILALCH